MLTKKLNTILALVLTGFSTITNADQQKQFNISDFSLFGIKIGMTHEEAKTALILNGSPNSTIVENNDTITVWPKDQTNNPHILITFKTDEKKPNLSHVYQISQVGNINEEMFERKYGKPTYYPENHNMEWCQKSSKANKDTDVKHCGQLDDDNASFVINNNTATLKDSGPDGRIIIIYVSSNFVKTENN